MVRAIVIGGTTSGVGKTTVSVGLTVAFARRGLKVQTFKVGPDYIDPSHLSAASGSPCRNLDTWLLPKEAVVELFRRAASRADVAVIEGVMGLFDGHSPDDDIGSTAEVAKLLDAPVVLVADASKVARSIAATVLGFKTFDPSLEIAGVVLNGVSGEGHLRFLKGPVEQAARVPIFGYLPKRDELKMPERHLGLIPTSEMGIPREFLDRLASAIEQTVDLDAILRRARDARKPSADGTLLFPQEAVTKKVPVAIAQDRAFSFYYEDGLDLLRAWGAALVPFSPLADERLPDGIAGVYIGGGFPEIFARELSDNAPMKASLKQAAERGMPIYAECGGLMCLGESLTDFEGRRHTMAGLIPASSLMTRNHLSIGYRTVEALSDGPLLKRGESARGHEFHWSTLDAAPSDGCAAYSVREQGGRPEGFRRGSVLASYIHLHMGSRPDLAPNFVRTCREWRDATG
ncbi:MAG: cobyrinate a,c-diamide synthase [Chloroflexi bacterium]|nr:cobyrinate a,c-diamide synthase [Chloroflexota bacterium]